MQKTVLITGASRGLGFEFSRQYKNEGFRVIAVCRSANHELEKLGVEVLSGVDLNEPGNFKRVIEFLKESSIDILINNAGIYYTEDLNSINFSHIKAQLVINSIVPITLTCALLNNLRPGSKVAMLSSILGSITKNEGRSHYGYRMSKAALNMGSVNLALDLKDKGIAVGIFHPGRVCTRMTDFDGDYSTEESAKKLKAQIELLDIHHSGKFIDLEGNEIPW